MLRLLFLLWRRGCWHYGAIATVLMCDRGADRLTALVAFDFPGDVGLVARVADAADVTGDVVSDVTCEGPKSWLRLSENWRVLKIDNSSMEAEFYHFFPKTKDLSFEGLEASEGATDKEAIKIGAEPFNSFVIGLFQIWNLRDYC